MIHINNIHRKFKSIWAEYKNGDLLSVCGFLIQLFEIKYYSRDWIKEAQQHNNWTIICQKLKKEYQS